MKTCQKCGLTFPLSEFNKSKRDSDGYRGTCKGCAHKMYRKRYSETKTFVGHKQKNLPLPSIERLRELFDYNPDGTFTRLTSKGNQRAGCVCAGKLEKHGYRRVMVDGEHYLFHRVVWQWHYGDDPEVLDHINNDRGDSRIENLRRVDRSSNARHQLLPSNNTSGFFGVYWVKSVSKWAAYISVNSKKISLGRHVHLKPAVLAWNEACNRLHGEFGKKKILHNVEEMKRRGMI